jgi:hypothetical protein
MIPIFVYFAEHSVTIEGRVFKVVPCEHCGTEYVYALERQATGCGTTFYRLDERGAREHAKAGAEDALRSYLENDFDPVPCPVCGHYQRYMFPKLYGGSPAWVSLARIVALLFGCLAAVGVMHWAVAYLQRPNDRALTRSGMALGILAALGAVVFALGAYERAHARRFDPNAEDQHARIAKGRSRAVTRAEFEAQQRERRAIENG